MIGNSFYGRKEQVYWCMQCGFAKAGSLTHLWVAVLGRNESNRIGFERELLVLLIQQQEQFDRQAHELVREIESTWQDYENAGLWIHEACRSTADQLITLGSVKICTREDFHELHDHMVEDGLIFQGIGFAPLVHDRERPIFEKESKEYLKKNYPNVTYFGFTGFEFVGEKVSERVYLQNSIICTSYKPQRIHISKYIQLSLAWSVTILDADRVLSTLYLDRPLSTS